MDVSEWIQNVLSELDKLPEGDLEEGLLYPINMSRLEGLTAQTSEIIVRLYAGTKLEDVYLNKLKRVNVVFNFYSTGRMRGIYPENFDVPKVLLVELLRSMQLT